MQALEYLANKSWCNALTRMICARKIDAQAAPINFAYMAIKRRASGSIQTQAV